MTLRFKNHHDHTELRNAFLNALLKIVSVPSNNLSDSQAAQSVHARGQCEQKQSLAMEQKN
jgi:hypothetical protein